MLVLHMLFVGKEEPTAEHHHQQICYYILKRISFFDWDLQIEVYIDVIKYRASNGSLRLSSSALNPILNFN